MSSADRLPQRPSLAHLRRQAKRLRDAVRAGDPAAVERMRRHLRLRPRAQLTLSAAQLIIAREYGFASWPRLKAEVEARAMNLAQRVDAFLEASVEGRTGRAARLLDGDPRIASFDISAAAAVGEVARVRGLLARDAALALRPDRRRGWPPLLYVCHSPWHRIDPARADRMLEVARLLLDAGASPDTHNGLRPRCGYRSALYGAAGIANNPAITRLLLERGADPNDDESLYHAAYHAPDLTCVRLLLEHGAVVDGSNALQAMIDTGSAEGVRMLLEAGAEPGRAGSGVSALAQAVVRDCGVTVVESLLAAGADPSTPGGDGRTPLRTAVRRGRQQVATMLLRYGARDDATEIDRFLGACARTDRAKAERLLAGRPGLLERLADEDRAVIVDAAEYLGTPAVRLMLELGFPMDARRAGDGATALHAAAYCGRAELVRLLIERGADTGARDAAFDSTALPWATVGSGERPHHGQQPDWVATVQILLDAGASSEDAWIASKPPSEEVAALLHAYGIGADDG